MCCKCMFYFLSFSMLLEEQNEVCMLNFLKVGCMDL